MGDRFYKEQAIAIKEFNKELASILKKDVVLALIQYNPDFNKKDLEKQLKKDLYVQLLTIEEQIMAWTQEDKDAVVVAYEKAGPTAENSSEIVKQLAEDFGQSPNGVRMILVQAGVYVKKEAVVATSAGAGTSAAATGTKRVSKESQIDSLRQAIADAGATVDDEIIGKLTGKSAAYFANVISAIAAK